MVARTREFRRDSRDRRIRAYFYGVRGDLYPYALTLKFEEITLYQARRAALYRGSSRAYGSQAADARVHARAAAAGEPGGRAAGAPVSLAHWQRDGQS